MKKLLLLLLFVTGMVWAQPANPQVTFRTTDPAGSCAPQPLWYNSTLGKLWGCDGGTWTLLASGASGGGPGGSNCAVQFDNSSAFGGDATNFCWDNAAKSLGIGGPNVTGIIVATYGNNLISTASADAFSYGLKFRKRGRTGNIAGSPTNGAELGYFQMGGWDTAAYQDGAAGVIGVACQDWTAGANCARLQFYATATGAAPNKYAAALTTDLFGLPSNEGFCFSSSTTDPTLKDTCIYRNAAGVVETNTGTPGTIGTVRSKYNSSDNTAGTTGNGFKDGLCTTASGGCGNSSNQTVRSFGASFDGGGSALTTAKVAYVTVPFGCTITGYNITADTGTVDFDIWKIATGTAIPTVTNTIISGSSYLALSSGTAVHSTSTAALTSTTVTAFDIVGVKIHAVSGATLVSMVIPCNAS